MLGELKKLPWGETVSFNDLDDDECTLEHAKGCVWIGLDSVPSVGLSRQQVASLIEHLQNWLDRGTFDAKEHE